MKREFACLENGSCVYLSFPSMGNFGSPLNSLGIVQRRIAHLDRYDIQVESGGIVSRNLSDLTILSKEDYEQRVMITKALETVK